MITRHQALVGAPQIITADWGCRRDRRRSGEAQGVPGTPTVIKANHDLSRPGAYLCLRVKLQGHDDRQTSFAPIPNLARSA